MSNTSNTVTVWALTMDQFIDEYADGLSMDRQRFRSFMEEFGWRVIESGKGWTMQKGAQNG